MDCSNQVKIFLKKNNNFYKKISYKQSEITKLEQFVNEAEKEKGVNWANAGRLFVFPIGIWATYENSNQAIDAANQREVYLTGIKQRKGCK